MFERASSEVCRRSTSFLREVACAERVPAEKRAMKSLQLRDFLFALGIFRFDARAHLRFGDDHVVVAAVVHDHGLVVDVGRVGANANSRNGGRAR